MSLVGRLRVKQLSELKADSTENIPAKQNEEIVDLTIHEGSCTNYDTGGRKKQTTNRKVKKKSMTTIKKTNAEPRTSQRFSKRLQKQPSPNQTRIDAFFKSSLKTYSLTQIKENSKEKSRRSISIPMDTKSCVGKPGRGRKRLFVDFHESNASNIPNDCSAATLTRKEKLKFHSKNACLTSECIDLCSENEEEGDALIGKETEKGESYIGDALNHQEKGDKYPLKCPTSTDKEVLLSNEKKITNNFQMVEIDLDITTRSATSSSLSKLNSNISKIDQPSQPVSLTPTKNSLKGVKGKKKRQCPPYKIVDGTSFAVDAFQFGLIKDVTYYFLTHFHADHYVGLTRKFAMPLVLSPITARLIRAFIPIEECFLHEIPLNEAQIIDDVEVTAIDANHCPGAVMFLFKLKTGKCILHTGDFRASPDMESEPVFWNNDIDVIYLDTTYINNKYAFCTQEESIWKAQLLIEEFQQKHKDEKILYICGAYVIGKEKFWSTIARNNRLMVWTEHRRHEALKAMQDVDILTMLCESPGEANLHVLHMGKLSYFSLVEYFESYNTNYDVCLAIRPSGWEQFSKPQYRGKINIIGIAYSEHSSHDELRRFVTYLRPKEVVSTVPVGKDLMVTAKVPQAWHKYDKFPFQHRNFQPLITSYLKTKAKARTIANVESKEDNTKENHLPNQEKSPACNTKSPNQLSLSLQVENDDADDDWLS